jgi:drug/metabolite transporter (DMT)-like permease
MVQYMDPGPETQKVSTDEFDVDPERSLLVRLGVTGQQACWLGFYCCTGISLGMSFEILQLHAGPARYETFFLALLGYWAQFLTSGFWVRYTGTWRQGEWNRRNVTALLISACFDGSAQALNYVAQIEGGIMLFTIFQSSVTIFACGLSLLLPWTPRLRLQQWLGIVAIVIGLMLTSIPNPIVARRSFSLGLLCSMLGSFCLASSYPVCELVFRLTPDPPSEEMACFLGSFINVFIFTTWTLVYTVPHWQEAVVQPISEARDPDLNWAVGGYIFFAVLVGIHALSFWKNVSNLGTVPTAVSKGAQQSGVFVFAHIFFCSQDPTECLWNNGKSHTMWSSLQKSVALTCCCVGVLLYSLGKPQRPQLTPETAEINAADETGRRATARKVRSKHRRSKHRKLRVAPEESGDKVKVEDEVHDDGNPIFRL